MESNHDAFRDCQEDQQLIDDVYFKNHLWAYAAAMPGDEGDDVHPDRPQRSIETIASFDQWSGTIENH